MVCHGNASGMLPETTGGEAYGFRPNERHRQISSGTAQPGLALRGMLGGKSIQKLALMPGRSEVGRASALTRGEYARRRNRSEEHTYEIQSLMRISYAVF